MTSLPPQGYPLSAGRGEDEEDLHTAVLAREQELIAQLLADPRALAGVSWLDSGLMLDEASRAILEDLRDFTRPEDLARGRVDLAAVSDRLAQMDIDIEPEELAQLRDSAAASGPGAASDAARAARDALIRLDLVDNGLLEARWAVPAPTPARTTPHLNEQVLMIIAEVEASLRAEGATDSYATQERARDRDWYELPGLVSPREADQRWAPERGYRDTPWGPPRPEQGSWTR